jgi:hypothetical protein
MYTQVFRLGIAHRQLGELVLPTWPLEFMLMRIIYSILCILGFVLPYSQFVPWVLAHGFDARLFVRELFSNRIGGFFGLDVIVSAFVLIPFVLAEGRRLRMQQLWAPVVGTLLVGVSFGLPLFLLMREPYLNEPSKAL